MATVNGKSMYIQEPVTINELVDQLGVNATHMAVEVNGQLVSRESYGTTKVDNDAIVEIITLAGGG
ncbi:sulfur carrier protein ThiS [Desulfurispira natronophila]|uniref:Sulfur carrier protein n=1 Tax=Desulfurispira natronophila TaxID=682562 RepID=A0A7W8DG23_9BACT|nr:sulfur carrier protein ThiS [Desulfurispira natronophila]MBB5021031.1 sulfur carrier protein [Desulfurispira natronophila]